MCEGGGGVTIDCFRSRSPEKFKIRTHATEWIQDKTL